ncbi:hypothetical protein NONI108955_33125 [Nocardia ninae]|uniref:Uncharacterized protein n=1 Tax=Nocardia ninae NBRC 108245 TaxID=1210091 RepID=A0A511MGT1_9NOCA|nr:hypothetical protein NN4_36350 [Nocardia ninae NBRC 108245]
MNQHTPNPADQPSTTPKPHHPRWHIERIDTHPMTTTQYDRAVETLAALILEWETSHHDPRKPQK